MASALPDAIAKLAWSLMTELGVPGLVRRHQEVAVDPEPVVLLASLAAVDDPRLRDQLVAWLMQHGKLLSVSRLGGLLKSGMEPLRMQFSRIAVSVRAAGGPRLPAPADAVPLARSPERKSMPFPLERPSLVRLRLRALSGVGARADVLAELLAGSEQWTRTVDLIDVGYSKRSVASVLSDLADAGVVERVSQGNAHRFRLRHPEALAEVVASAGLHDLNQVAVLRFTEELVELDGLGELPPVVRRVEATKRRGPLLGIAAQLDLAAPPQVRGVEEAWEMLTTWGLECVRELGGQTRDSNSENIDE